jgi:hypothetical protein
MEAVEAAIFLKRAWSKMYEDYFSAANFLKSTGDGLLVIYHFDEGGLAPVLTDVVARSIRLVEDFPSFFQDEPEFTWEIPGDLGIGIAFGTASQLHTGKKILDYSGERSTWHRGSWSSLGPGASSFQM